MLFLHNTPSREILRHAQPLEVNLVLALLFKVISTRDDSQRRFSIATLLRHCFEWFQHSSNIAVLCCAKNHRCESSRVTAPLVSMRTVAVRWKRRERRLQWQSLLTIDLYKDRVRSVCCVWPLYPFKAWYTFRAVNPRSIQILRIDRGGIVDDVITHGTWRQLYVKYSPILMNLRWHKTREKDVFVL